MKRKTITHIALVSIVLLSMMGIAGSISTGSNFPYYFEDQTQESIDIPSKDYLGAIEVNNRTYFSQTNDPILVWENEVGSNEDYSINIRGEGDIFGIHSLGNGDFIIGEDNGLGIRYNKSFKENGFQLKGTNQTAIYTQKVGDQYYVLPRQTSKILIFDENGFYTGNYKDLSTTSSDRFSGFYYNGSHYIANEDEDNTIHVYDSNLNYLYEKSSVDSGPKGFTEGPNGNYYIGGVDNADILEFDKSLNHVNTYSMPANPTGIAYYNNNFYVAFDSTNEVKEYDTSFSLINTYSINTELAGDDIEDMAIYNNKIYAEDPHTNRIIIFDENWNYINRFDRQTSNEKGIYFNEDLLYSSRGQYVEIYYPNGTHKTTNVLDNPGQKQDLISNNSGYLVRSENQELNEYGKDWQYEDTHTFTGYSIESGNEIYGIEENSSYIITSIEETSKIVLYYKNYTYHSEHSVDNASTIKGFDIKNNKFYVTADGTKVIRLDENFNNEYEYDVSYVNDVATDVIFSNNGTFVLDRSGRLIQVNENFNPTGFNISVQNDAEGVAQDQDGDMWVVDNVNDDIIEHISPQNEVTGIYKDTELSDSQESYASYKDVAVGIENGRATIYDGNISGLSTNLDNSNIDVIYERNSDKYGIIDNEANKLYVHEIQEESITEYQDGDLTIKANSYMKHNSTQKITVYSGTTDITQNATIISNNTSVITVSEDTLIATSNTSINNKVSINVEYFDKTGQKNITVANRTIENIGIMPNTQWVVSVLGFDESQAKWGIGSEIQWIFLAILVGSMIAWIYRNEYIGVGIIDGLLILFWVLGYVSLGIVLVGVFYGIFAAYQLRGTPSRSDTKVGKI